MKSSNSSLFRAADKKYIGWALAGITLIITIVVLVVTFSVTKQRPIPTANIDDLKLVGGNCEYNGNVGWCNKLLAQAVAPEMYLRDALYRNKVKALKVKYSDTEVIPFTELVELFRRSVPLTKVRLQPTTIKAFQELSKRYNLPSDI